MTEICTRYTGGCTLADATGFWKDDAGMITSEQTIQCVVEDITEEDVHAIADEVIASLNKNSVLIETRQVPQSFTAAARRPNRLCIPPRGRCF